MDLRRVAEAASEPLPGDLVGQGLRHVVVGGRPLRPIVLYGSGPASRPLRAAARWPCGPALTLVRVRSTRLATRPPAELWPPGQEERLR
jgi:hypothetical protein